MSENSAEKHGEQNQIQPMGAPSLLHFGATSGLGRTPANLFLSLYTRSPSAPFLSPVDFTS